MKCSHKVRLSSLLSWSRLVSKIVIWVVSHL